MVGALSRPTYTRTGSATATSPMTRSMNWARVRDTTWRRPSRLRVANGNRADDSPADVGVVGCLAQSGFGTLGPGFDLLVHPVEGVGHEAGGGGCGCGPTGPRPQRRGPGEHGGQAPPDRPRQALLGGGDHLDTGCHGPGGSEAGDHRRSTRKSGVGPLAQHRGQGRGRTDGEQGGHDRPGAPVATGHQGPERADRQRRAGPEGQLVGRRSPDGPAHRLLGALLEQLLSRNARTEGRGVGRRVHCPGPGVSAGARGQPPRPGRGRCLPEGDRTQGRGCRQPGDHALLDRGARHQARLEPDRGNQSGGQRTGTCCG